MLKEKFKFVKGGYRFNKVLGRWFFSFMFLLIIPQLLWSLNEGFFGDGWVAVECHSDTGYCTNPYYSLNCVDKLGDWCLQETLPHGFVYNPLPWYYDLYQVPIVLLFISYIFINHFLYNKGFLRKIFNE